MRQDQWLQTAAVTARHSAREQLTGKRKCRMTDSIPGARICIAVTIQNHGQTPCLVRYR
jgi:hypothetical protein